ncbi:MAG: alpha/beta hydrolase [Anaerolineales bacterium]|nr:alpha/beta hydrolase [Anaerolineales bacterium]
MSASLEYKMISTNGVNLHVVFAGPQDGKAVILLHGFPEFWRGWKKQIEPLASAGYRVIVPDQRGYNLSDKPKYVSAYHIDILVRDITGLMDTLGHERAFIVGHDWGAAVAWQLATYYSGRVEKLGILNVPHPVVMVQTLRKSIRQLRKSWYMFFFQIPWLPEWSLGRNNAQGASELLHRSGKPGTFTDEDLVHYRQAWTQPGALTAMVNWYRSAIRSGLGNNFKSALILPRISVPTLMLWGKQDGALSCEMAQPSIDLCTDGNLIFFEEATHWVQHDEPEKVADHLLEFFRS